MKWNEKYSTELSCLDMIYVVATTGRIDASLLCNDLDQWTVRLVFWYAVKRPSRLALVSKEDRPPCPQHIPSRTREMQGNSYCVVLLSITKQKKKGKTKEDADALYRFKSSERVAIPREFIFEASRKA